jgi:hypothetical protein
MADPRMLVHLKVLQDKGDTGVVPALKVFTIGDPAVVEGEGEVVPILSWVDDNLSRFVVSNAPSSSWGRVSPPPMVLALPNRTVKKKDAIFLLTGQGEDRDEPNPKGDGRLHFVHLGQTGRLWKGPGARLYLYRLDAVQTKALLPPPKAPA